MHRLLRLVTRYAGCFRRDAGCLSTAQAPCDVRVIATVHPSCSVVAIPDKHLRRLLAIMSYPSTSLAVWTSRTGSVELASGEHYARSTYSAQRKGKMVDRAILVRTWYTNGLIREEERNTFCEALATTLAEWKTAAAHPNVAAFTGVLVEGRQLPAFVRPLYQYNAREYVVSNPGVDVAHILVEVASALSYLHCLEPIIVHGNMKAANVLIDTDGRAVISDLGLNELAIGAEGRGCDGPVNDIHWTAPELIELDDARTTTSTDVYGFAMTALELYSGDIPYGRDRRSFAILKDVLSGVRPCRPLSTALNDDVWHVIEACWRQNSRERPAMSLVRTWLDVATLSWVTR